MATRFIFTTLIILSLALVYLIPLCRAYLAGLEAARDPTKFNPSRNPWPVFDRVFWRELRPWWPLWAGVGLCDIFLIVSRMPPPVRWAGGLEVLSIILGFMLLLYAACAAWSTLCRRPWMLTTLSALTSLGLFLLLFFAIVKLLFPWLPDSFRAIRYEHPIPFDGGQRPSSYILNCAPYYLAAMSLLLAWAVRCLNRRPKDAWYDFQ